MPKEFSGFGIKMLYPDNWKVEEEEGVDAVAFESPEGAFFSVSRIDPSNADPMAEVQAAMAAEYERVEEEPLAKEVAGQELTGVTQRFVYLDLIIASHILIIPQGEERLLVQFQGEDRDMDNLDAIFSALLTSLYQSFQAS